MAHDPDAGKIAAILYLKGGSLLDAFDASLAESSAQAVKLGITLNTDKTKTDLLEFLSSAISLVLYLCSQQEFTHRGVNDASKNPEPKKYEKRMATFSC